MADLSPNIIGDYININDLNTLIKMQAVGYKARAHLDAAYEKLTLNTGGFEVQRQEKISRRKGTVAELISDLGDFKANFRRQGDTFPHDIRIQPPKRRRNPKFVCVKPQSYRTREAKSRRPRRSGRARCDVRPLLLLLATGGTTGRKASEGEKAPAAIRMPCVSGRRSIQRKQSARVLACPRTGARAEQGTSVHDGKQPKSHRAFRDGRRQDGAKPK